MKFIANPVSVEAHQIVEINVFHDTLRERKMPVLKLDDGTTFTPTDEMLSRIIPRPGDYVVKQEDGYTSINPRAVFERKYSPEGAKVRFTASDNVAAFLRETAGRVRDSEEAIETAVVVYGTYGGSFYVESTESGVVALGLLDIGHRTMIDSIVRGPKQEQAPAITAADALADLNDEPRPDNPSRE